jgi:Zn/Cd-binding protein ZinT
MRGKHVKTELSANVRSGLEKFAKTGKHSVKPVSEKHFRIFAAEEARDATGCTKDYQ